MPSTWAPFNGKPTSLQVITSTYTVPSGYYARVTANAKNGGSVSVNGSTILSSDASSWSVLSGSPVQILSSASSSRDFQPSPDTTQAAFSTATAVDKNNVAESFWVPAGATIAVSGDARAMAQVYQG